MSISTLISTNSSPKFKSQLVSIEALKNLPIPVSLGRHHKPISHAVLVDGILAEIDRRDFIPIRTQLALGNKGALLFGVIDLQPKSFTAETLATATIAANPDRGVSFGFRSSTNSALAIKAVAGSRVFVCDNLTMSGDLIAFLRKSTTHLDLGLAIAGGFDKFLTQTALLDQHIQRLTLAAVTDGEAKQLIFDVFNASVVPVRLFEDVAKFYFAPTDEQTDCQPRTRWGVHNSFTRAMKDLMPARQFSATVALGRAFGLTADAL